MANTNKIIFDTDPGIDDSMALLLAHASDRLEVLGITTVFGNATIENATRNAQLIRSLFDMNTDVAKGSDTPLVVDAGEPTTFVHGFNGLGDIDIPKVRLEGVDPRPAYRYIVDTVKDNPGEITLVAVGRLTNIALAIEECPEIIPLVKEVVIMGGAFGYNGHCGNVSPFAEANIIGDPHAAELVLTSDWPVTVVGLDVTMEVIMDETYLQDLKLSSEKYGAFIYDISRYYLDFHRNHCDIDGFHVHDSSAIMYLIHPELFETVKGNIRVVTEGPAIGHTMLKTENIIYPRDEWTNFPKQNVCIGVCEKGFLDAYKRILSQ